MKKINVYKIHLNVFLIIVVCLIGLVLPLHYYIKLDSDSIAYINSSVTDSVQNGFSNWGIYRSFAIAIKSLIYNNIGLSDHFIIYAIIFSISSKIIFFAAVFSFLKISYQFIPYVMAAAICNIFFLDIVLLLSRSINDLIGSLLGALFLYVLSKTKSRQYIFFLSILFVFVGLVGYESYILYVFPLVVVFRKERATSVISGFLCGVCIIAVMQLNGFYLNHPKLIHESIVVIKMAHNSDNYVSAKLGQFFITVRLIKMNEIIYPLILAVILFFILKFSANDSKYSAVPTFNISTALNGALISLLGWLPVFITLLIAKVGPHDSKIQWLLLGGGMWMTTIGCVISESGKFRIVSIARFLLSFIFFLSIILVIQLSKGLKNHDYYYIDKSIFRNLPIVYSAKNIYIP